jgi:hypothetical protein
MKRPTGRQVAAAVAMLVLLAMAPFFFAAGLMAPSWAVVVFVLCWVTCSCWAVCGCVAGRCGPFRSR